MNVDDCRYDSRPGYENIVERPKDYTPMNLSLSLLPNDYGGSLEPAATARDPLYALTELFSLLAMAESCYLDTVASVLDDNLSQSIPAASDDNTKARAALVYSWRCLERRRLQITDSVAFLRTKQSDELYTERGPIEKTAIAQVLHDFDFLQDRANRLQDRCNQELSFIISDAAVKDGEWNRLQARNNHKFAVLATVYLPLSFACSIFGMQFLTVSTVRLGFLLWAAIALPLLIISFIFLILGKGRGHELLALVRTWFGFGVYNA